MMFSVLVLFSINWIYVSSIPTNSDGFASFSPSNLLSEKQTRKDFREFDENENSLLLKPHYCVKRAECISLNYSTCFGVKIPYSKTSLDLVSGIATQEEAQERLHKWHQSLIHIPKCWAVVQPFLCALFMPKCEDNQVVLPSKEMCDVIQHPCRILNVDNQWPAEFNCTPYKHEKCWNDRELKLFKSFNTTSRCMPPLVQAESPSSYYEGIEGCGVQCQDPFFSDEDRQTIRTFVMWGSWVAWSSNLIAVLTFVIDWKSTRKYPSTLALLFVNFCFFVVSCAYIVQFLPGSNDNMICNKDGTLKTSEPRLRGNLSCVANFAAVYYFLIAGIVWFVIFAYAWLLSLKGMERGKINGRKDKRNPYYHLVAWSVPLVLTVVVIAFPGVDGDSLFGICFVGVVDKQYRLLFLLGPLLLSSSGLILFMIGMYNLCCLKITSKEHITSKGNSRINNSITRVCVFLALIALFGTCTFIYHIYDYLHYEEWKKSFRKFIICKLGISGDAERCRMENGPGATMVQVQIIALFGIHVAMASWILKTSCYKAWSTWIKKRLNKGTEEQVTFQRHKLIARAYAKRKLLQEDSARISINMSNSRKDVVGLNFELNSVASNNLSSTWAKALPKLITRRNAVTNILSGSNSSQRGSSLDSEISYSVRRVSVESRRHSLDSTVSVQAVELTKTVRKRPRNKRVRRKGRTYKHKSTKRKISSRRASNASQASNLEREVLAALKITNSKCQANYEPNLKRRPAIPDIEVGNLKLLGIGEKLLNYSDYSDCSINSGELYSESETS